MEMQHPKLKRLQSASPERPETETRQQSVSRRNHSEWSRKADSNQKKIGSKQRALISNGQLSKAANMYETTKV
jgi:hypothetical protein